MIDAEGEQLGIMPTSQALNLAREQHLDLVEVAPTNVPPVCRVLDYGRLRYLHAKKERESKKTQKNVTLREVRFRPKIGVHDVNFKVKKIRELLNEGAKVKVAVFFRGREVAHQQIGMSILKRVVDTLKEEAKLEQVPSFEQRHLSIILAPLARKIVQKLPDKEEETSDAETQDAQRSTGEVAGDGLGADHAPETDEQPQPLEEAKKSPPAVRRKKVPSSSL